MSTDNAMQIIQNMNNERTETALASICDDLSFSMYVEESIVETIRELEQKKGKAVNGKWTNIRIVEKPQSGSLSFYLIYETLFIRQF